MSAISLKAVALRYLAQREHSRAELEHKLRRHLSKVSRAHAAGRRRTHTATDAVLCSAAKDASPGDAAASGPALGDPDASDPAEGDSAVNDADASSRISAALDALAVSGLLSDERTAASVLRSQGQRYGVLRIRHTLQAKGLSAELVADTVASARDTELQRAQAVWARRFGTPAQGPKDRARQMRFLAQRGFDADTVARVMRKASGSLRADDAAALESGPEDADTDRPAKKHSQTPDSEPNASL